MIKFGIVGAGIISGLHKEALLQNSECEITAICDIAIEKAEQLACDTDAKVYSDYKAMAENEKLDAVILNLPHFLHKDVTIYFLEKKIAVLCEKPMANTVLECDEMIAASKATKTPLAIGHVQRYFECYRELKKIIKENRLGKLCSFTETRNVDYFTNRPKWFLSKKQSGGGPVMNYGAHTLDKLFYTTDLKVEKVMALGSNMLTDDDVEASAQLLMQLSDGVTASVTYCGSRLKTQYDAYFYFTDGSAWIENGTRLWISSNKSPYEKVELDYETGFIAKQLTEFVKFIKGEENEMVTAEYARDIIAVLEQAFEQIG